eukprot:2828932-Lingulodinium_polyedra.AAC.1
MGGACAEETRPEGALLGLAATHRGTVLPHQNRAGAELRGRCRPLARPRRAPLLHLRAGAQPQRGA